MNDECRKTENLALPVTKIIVLINREPRGLDRVSIETALPFPLKHNPGNERLSLRFECSPGLGVEYVKKHFPREISLEVIDTQTGKINIT